jgi:gliding motility-associated-like protein
MKSLSLRIILVIALLGLLGIEGHAEGTKELERFPADGKSVCKLMLSYNLGDERIPFALVGCAAEYRLNIRINNHTAENIYFGFGDAVSYFDTTNIVQNVQYQLKDPAGNIVTGYSLKNIPDGSGDPGYIRYRGNANNGPNINNSNPSGYTPLILDPQLNGDYILEFSFTDDEFEFKYFDVTVATGTTPLPGRLWSKSWQLSSGSVYSDESYSNALFYIYTNDSIVTRFDCNGLAGGLWTIYSNEWGTSVTGSWSERRRSTPGNSTVRPQHMIFINEPDEALFPSGITGQMLGAEALPHVCDTVISFAAEVSKAGNIEVMLDLPPLNATGYGPEDVQLGYHVNPGYNTLSPPWDGRNGFGQPLSNGTMIEATITFLNGLTNIPLYDVEDNPNGFKVDLVRPAITGITKLKLFWDDTQLPYGSGIAQNVIDGCIYSGTGQVSGCHDWRFISFGGLGEINTVNSWWFLSSDAPITIPITLEFLPRQGTVTGPPNICAGQLATFMTTEIPYVQQYVWEIKGPGFSYTQTINAPETSLTYQFTPDMQAGYYTVSVKGRNLECGDGASAFITSYLYDQDPPPIQTSSANCLNSVVEYHIPGNYISVDWDVKHGQLVGSDKVNPVRIKWNAVGFDTITVYSTNADCGTRLSVLPIEVFPLAKVNFDISTEATSCPGLPLTFTDQSTVAIGNIAGHDWVWGDGFADSGNDFNISHVYHNSGNHPVELRITTSNGCVSDTTKFVTIIPPPVAGFSAFHNCIDQAVELTDQTSGEAISTWNWNFNNAPVTTSNTTTNKPFARYHSTGEFDITLIVSNEYGCFDTIAKQVTIHQLPVADYLYEIPCQGTYNTFTDNSTLADTLITYYEWNASPSSVMIPNIHENPAEIYLNESSDYSVKLKIMDGYGCLDSITKVIDTKPQPAGNFIYTDNYNKTQGLMQFENLTTGAIEYYWNFGNSDTSIAENPMTKYNLEAEYPITLIATSIDGCKDTLVKFYYYMPGLWVPNGFTPNNDGLNDIFRPATERTTLDPYLLQVFNRWGQCIFTTYDTSVGWDGTFEGRECDPGMYAYVMKYREGKIDSRKTIIKKGQITLIR